MENKQKIIKKKRRQKSIFCEKKPASNLIWLAIHLKDEKLWVACKGKVYQNGWVRYTYQGKETKVSPSYYHHFPGYSEEQILEQVKILNLQFLEYNHPAQGQRKRWYEMAERYENMIMDGRRIVETVAVAAEQPTQPPAAVQVDEIPRNGDQ